MIASVAREAGFNPASTLSNCHPDVAWSNPLENPIRIPEWEQ
jgi:hypothetical protein